MSGPLHSKTPTQRPHARRLPARRWLGRRAGLGAAALLLMLAPAGSQTHHGPTSVAPLAEKLIDAVVPQADLIKAAKDLGANARQIQLKVVIPGAIPSIFAGLHLGMGIAIILVVAAEMIGGSSQGGMGWLLISSGQVMETEKVFASLIVLAVVGAVVIKLQQWIDRRVAPWVNYNEG